MKKIEIDGRQYQVVENLGYQLAGYLCKMVQTERGEAVAVKDGGVWRWWTAKDRVRPASKYIGLHQEAQ